MSRVSELDAAERDAVVASEAPGGPGATVLAAFLDSSGLVINLHNYPEQHCWLITLAAFSELPTSCPLDNTPW